MKAARVHIVLPDRGSFRRDQQPASASVVIRTEPADDTSSAQAIRQLVASAIPGMTYRKFNLLEPFTALGRFDIVFCRNVLIYFDPKTKTEVLDRIARVLAPDGFMMLGAAETIVGLTDSFQAVPGRRGLYQLASQPLNGRKPDVAPTRLPSV